VAAEIVHDGDVAWSKRRHQDLLDIGKEASPVDGSVDDARRIDPIGAQRGQKGQRAPMAVFFDASKI
jgi:hypothetical protein